MGLPIAKLGYQRQDRRSILLPTRQALQNHAGVLRQRAGEAVAREELRLIAVVWGARSWLPTAHRQWRTHPP